ncbi:MAG: thiol:disulfide interchange protein DsbA/DsbL [Gammaproteobacteria bacterium]|nr:thiol:disulfide interchange protein DsbA/DsbL [Gammaproteobacteria bacterium]
MRYLATLFLVILLSVNASAQNSPMARFIEGIDYQILETPVKTLKKDKIEVTEAFSYICGHCFTFESPLNKWKKTLADDVAFVKLPVIFRDNMNHYARIMYTAEALGVADQVNKLVFRAIHIEKKRIRNANKVAPLFESAGIPAEKFEKIYKSFGIDSQVRQASVRTRAMKITGTPQIVVDGRYTVSVPRKGGHPQMLKIVDFLVDKIRSERK